MAQHPQLNKTLPRRSEQELLGSFHKGFVVLLVLLCLSVLWVQQASRMGWQLSTEVSTLPQFVPWLVWCGVPLRWMIRLFWTLRCASQLSCYQRTTRSLLLLLPLVVLLLSFLQS